MTPVTSVIPCAFIWRRLHSLTGIWLSMYLIVHLFVNSQAGLFIGDDGKGFIHSVNSIQEVSYLPIVEIIILGIPILIHMIWGIMYVYTAKYNSFGNNEKEPYLPNYSRNHAYTWQRITSWVLVLGIIAHIIHMRFIEHPVSAQRGADHFYMIRVGSDDGLYTLAERLGVTLFDKNQIEILKKDLESNPKDSSHFSDFLTSFKGIFQKQQIVAQNPSKKVSESLESIKIMQDKEWIKALQKNPLHEGQVIAVSDNFGTAELLMVRETFKMPIMLALYTIFVLAACFHGFNGLWTFMISWGVTLSATSQILMRRISTGIMIFVAFLGLSAIWMTYWINLKQ